MASIPESVGQGGAASPERGRWARRRSNCTSKSCKRILATFDAAAPAGSGWPRQTGRHDLAVASIRQSLALAPQQPEAYSNLGNAL